MSETVSVRTPNVSDDARVHEVSAEWLKRFDRAGPRYTSYPTAPEFKTDITGADLLATLDGQRDAGVVAPLSLYFHLPFCEERCHFCGCNVIISKRHDIALPYLDSIEREMDTIAAHVDPKRPVAQIHFGGGTPSYLTPEQMDRLCSAIEARFTVSPDAERAIEVHPAHTTAEHLDVLAAHGFNRISMGIQDFDEKVQDDINRHQTIEESQFLTDYARSKGFTGVNYDLIYGLPFQTVESFSRTLDTVCAMRPDRFAVYSFAHIPWIKPHQKVMNVRAMPRGLDKLRLLALSIEKLCAAGYLYIGMDHFALPTDELSLALADGTLRRNFMGYTTKAGTDLIGIGQSSISEVNDLYVQNPKKLPQWKIPVDEGRHPGERGTRRTFDDRVRNAVIHDIMCKFEVKGADISARFGIDFDTYFASELDVLCAQSEDGLVEVDAEGVHVTMVGRLLVRIVAMAFDVYLKRPREDDGPLFSGTV